MAGLSKKLLSLVQAANDPDLLVFAYSRLGVGVPRDKPNSDRWGFGERLDGVRRQLLVKLLTSNFTKPFQHEH
jgi:hypothetical protein